MYNAPTGLGRLAFVCVSVAYQAGHIFLFFLSWIRGVSGYKARGSIHQSYVKQHSLLVINILRASHASTLMKNQGSRAFCYRKTESSALVIVWKKGAITAKKPLKIWKNQFEACT